MAGGSTAETAAAAGRTGPSGRSTTSSLRAIDWRFVGRGLVIAAVITAFAAAAYGPIRFNVFTRPEYLWIDTHIYFRATQAWLDGGNPWQSAYLGIPFAAPPPALLLNLPLIPFGETAASAFWIIANTVGLVVIVRRLRLPIWWLLYQPILEGWLGGSPDVALAALLLIGGGSAAALVKPYSIPALIADHRWRAIAAAVLAGAVTLPFLPWGTFVASQAEVAEAFARFGHPVSAFGDPALMAVVVVALLSLGWRRGWMLAIPGLLAMQPHYLLFALPVLTRSLLLGATTTFGLSHVTAWGVVIYAAVERGRWLVARLRSRPGPAAVPG